MLTDEVSVSILLLFRFCNKVKRKGNWEKYNLMSNGDFVILLHENTLKLTNYEDYFVKPKSTYLKITDDTQ